jgi:hypothetical protein
VIDLSLYHRGRMPLRRLEVAAVFGTGNLDQALGGAANRADFLALSRAESLIGAFLTQWASHVSEVTAFDAVEVECNCCHSLLRCATVSRFGDVPEK